MYSGDDLFGAKMWQYEAVACPFDFVPTSHSFGKSLQEMQCLK